MTYPTKSRKPTFKSILAAEILIQNQTYETYEKWFVRFSQSIDVLLGLCYLECDFPPDVNSDEYRFVVHALDAYYEISLSFRSCSVLMEKGLYHDALNCCRSILECLVKYKYLHDHKNLIEAYENDGKDSNGKKVTIRRAWEYVAGPDSQKKTYKFLSKFEHKNFGSCLPRLNASITGQSTFSPIPIFNKSLAEVVINNLMYLLFGYINLSKKFFSYKHNHSDSHFFEDYENIWNWLHEQIQKRKTLFPQAVEWCLVMEKIIY